MMKIRPVQERNLMMFLICYNSKVSGGKKLGSVLAYS